MVRWLPRRRRVALGLLVRVLGELLGLIADGVPMGSAAIPNKPGVRVLRAYAEIFWHTASWLEL